MFKRIPNCVIRIGLLALCMAAIGLPIAATAGVQRVEIISRGPWLGGKPLADVGPYEKLVGRVYYAVDPKAAANRRIADVALAPRNAHGLVEFSGDFVVLRPVNPGNSRHSVLLEVANRGRTQLNGSLFSNEKAGDGFPLLSLDEVKLSNAFVFEQGFTVIWVGWQSNLSADALHLNVPVAPVESLVRTSFLFDSTQREALTTPAPLGEACSAADATQRGATLTAKTRFEDKGRRLPPEIWAFASTKDGKVVPDRRHLMLNGGFQPDVLYELVYRGARPPVAGLGLAAIRDFVSYLKHGDGRDSLLGDKDRAPNVLGFGYSQGARFLRQYLYDGFSADEQGRPTFDGLFIASAGAGRGSFNHRYAMPGQAGNSVGSALRPVDLFPFSDLPETDPVTGRRGGLLDRPRASRTLPRIFYTYSSTEYWARNGSLAYTSVDGRRELPLEPQARLYFFSGTPHAPGAFPPSSRRRDGPGFSNLMNFVDGRQSFRALLIDLQDWTANAIEPPASVYPMLPDQLVALGAVKFPKLRDVPYPVHMPKNWRMDYGPRFPERGIIDREPPRLGRAYTILVPQVDSDGNDVGGIALPFISVPLGTYTGWNHERVDRSGFGYLGGLFGSFIPFALNDAQRIATDDPRRAIAARYADKQDYLARIESAAQELVSRRFLIADDVPRMVQRAGAEWDAVVAGAE